jgi:hypothetical protein
MKHTYIINKKDMEPFLYADGTPTGEYEVDVEIDLADLDDEAVFNYTKTAPGIREDILADLTVEEIVNAIKEHKDNSGRWEYIDRIKLMEALQ